MRPHLRTALATAVAGTVAAALAGGLPTAVAAPASAAAARHADDFNGDGHRDYARQDDSMNGRPGGAVQVTYGTATGPGTKVQYIHQGSAGVPGADEDGDNFGASLAHADLDSDGYADLVVGSPWEDVNGRENQGGVTILWGSASGLSGGTAVPNKAPGEYRNFGRDVATGDFTGDGKADLAAVDVLATSVHRGGFSRSGTTGSVTRHVPAVGTVLEPVSLVAGRVTNDKATDLVVLGQGYANDKQTSSALFLRGGSTITRGKLLHHNTSRANWSAEGVIADFDGNGYGDIAIEDPYHSGVKGAVTVWRGGSTGPGTTYRLTQDTAGVSGASENGDAFGVDVSAGDVDGDGYPDLAIGANEEDVDGRVDAGMVHILRGGSSGLTGAGSQAFTLATSGVPGTMGADTYFGWWVRLRDADRDGKADLFTYSSLNNLLFKGTASGITTTGVQESLRADFAQ
ncbi:FG-GAP repeat protein [Streptomyces macrosporus]|uniref:FG-GAP repeat protein n=1 Tax=Streptomyces macrosporus TaxID=44032 RepID=A0ABP5WQV3_9ACTN